MRNHRCVICGELSVTKLYGENLCNIKRCELELRSNIVIMKGFTKFINYLEGCLKKYNQYLKLRERMDELDSVCLMNRRIKKFKGIDYVYRVNLPNKEVSMLVGLNYAYKINKRGKVFKIYNLNDEYESLEEIKRRLSEEDKFILEPFFLILDDRKSIVKWNSLNS